MGDRRRAENICLFPSLNGTNFTPLDLVQPTRRRCKNVATPDNKSRFTSKPGFY
jgi:hypothetical protein